MARKKTSTKANRKYTNEDLAPDNGRDTSKSIPIHELEDWIGYVENLHKIDAIYLGWDNRFRINVYCATKVEGSIYEKYSIDRSYHVRYNNGRFEDKSNQKSPKKLNIKYL